MYNVRFTKTALKSIKKIRKEDQARIVKNIEELVESPFTKANIKKLKDSSYFRLRVGDYRILFNRNDTTEMIDIIDVLHRRDAYKWR